MAYYYYNCSRPLGSCVYSTEKSKIMLDDIVKNYSENELADLALYKSIIDLLKEVKLTYGGEGLNSTLKRHKKLTLFLQKFQKRSIIDLEGKITDNLHCRLGD